jgi:hypothetical protein
MSAKIGDEGESEVVPLLKEGCCVYFIRNTVKQITTSTHESDVFFFLVFFGYVCLDNMWIIFNKLFVIVCRYNKIYMDTRS